MTIVFCKYTRKYERKFILSRCDSIRNVLLTQYHHLRKLSPKIVAVQNVAKIHVQCSTEGKLTLHALKRSDMRFIFHVVSLSFPTWKMRNSTFSISQKKNITAAKTPLVHTSNTPEKSIVFNVYETQSQKILIRSTVHSLLRFYYCRSVSHCVFRDSSTDILKRKCRLKTHPQNLPLKYGLQFWRSFFLFHELPVYQFLWTLQLHHHVSSKSSEAVFLKICADVLTIWIFQVYRY